MKKKLEIILIFLISISFLIGGSGMIFTLIRDSKTVKAAKKLVVAIENNDIQTVSNVIERYPKSVNTLPSFSPWWWQLITEQPDVYYPLQEACSGGNYDVTKFLIENGAEVNQTWKGIESSRTPLMWAVISGSDRTTDILKLLLEHGANRSAKDSQGKTAYDYAVQNEFLELAELLKP